MYLIMFLLGIILSMVMTAFIYKTIESGKLLIYSIAVFFCLYVVVSGILIGLDCFEMMKSLCIVSAIELLVSLCLFVMGSRKIPRVEIKATKYVPLLLVLAVAGCIVSYNKSEFYALSQDQGFYQVRAMFYMGGKYDNDITFKEYDNLSEDEARELYKNKVDDAQGGVFVDGDGLTYQLRGLGTFPAQMALWGKMFGKGNMNGILTLFYVTMLGAVWILCDNLKCKKYVSYMITVLEGLCPMVVWSAKNTLCEIFIAMIIAIFLAMIFEKKQNAATIYLSVLPVGAYCFYHLSVTIIIPLLVMVYWCVSLYRKKADYLWASITLLVLYGFGQMMMSHTSNWYWYCNLDRIFSATKRIINENNFVGIVWVCIGIYAAAVTILYFSGLHRRMCDGFVFNGKSFNAKGCTRSNIIFAIITLILSAVSVLMFVKSRGRLMPEQETDCLSMFGVMLFTEFITIPLAAVGMICLSGKYLKNYRLMVIWLMFFYCMTVMYIGVYGSMRFYFYYGRYLVPFLLIMFLGAVPVFNRIKARFVIPVMAVLLGIVIYMGRIVYKEQDVTLADFDVVFNMTDNVDKNSAVIIVDNNLIMSRLLMPMKALTDADVYFADSADNAFAQNEMDSLKENYDNIYMLVYDEWFPSEDNFDWELIYRDTMNYSGYERCNGLPLPRTTTFLSRDIGLFVYTLD